MNSELKKHYNVSLETLKRWKEAPASAKLQWLEDSVRFFKKFRKIKPS